MDVDTALDKFNKVITASAAQRRIANARIEHFTAILKKADPGITVERSGSWVRDTSLGPLHDVDLIIVFPSNVQPDWDGGSGTANLALGQVAKAIQDGLSTQYGLPYVWKTELRNHVVKCYVDSRMATDSPTAKGFSVDVMPAIRNGSTLRVPERRDDRWRTVDPEHLKEQSARRQREWKHYTAMVRLLKHWAREHPELHISPLAMEVLALKCLPHPPMFGTMTRTEALKDFFTAAAATVMKGVSDPAGHSGEIAPRLKRRQARDLFRTMADLAATAEAWATSSHKYGEDIAVYYLRLISARGSRSHPATGATPGPTHGGAKPRGKTPRISANRVSVPIRPGSGLQGADRPPARATSQTAHKDQDQVGNAATAASHVLRTTNPTKRTGPRTPATARRRRAPTMGSTTGLTARTAGSVAIRAAHPTVHPAARLPMRPTRAHRPNGLRPAGDAGCRRHPG